MKDKIIKSKAWEWDANIDEYWKKPADEIYSILFQWKEKCLHTILDLGCGIGRHSILFAENGFKVYSYDLSESGINKLSSHANKHNLDIDIQRGDITCLPYPDNKFDGLIAFHSIYHTDMNGLKKVMSEIHRVTKPGGEIFITYNSKENPSFKNPANKIIDENTIIRMEEPEVGIPHTFLDFRDIMNILNEKEILKIQQIEDYFDGETSKHFFVRYIN